MSETDLVRAILEYLHLRGITAWRNNTGAYKAGKRFIRFGYVGSGDILGVIPPTGKLLSIECKTKKNKPSHKQEEFMELVVRAGGIAFVARSIEDVQDGLRLP